jgi:hypothetical protein
MLIYYEKQKLIARQLTRQKGQQVYCYGDEIGILFFKMTILTEL